MVARVVFHKNRIVIEKCHCAIITLWSPRLQPVLFDRHGNAFHASGIPFGLTLSLQHQTIAREANVDFIGLEARRFSMDDDFWRTISRCSLWLATRV